MSHAQRSMERPNVLLVLTDQQRFDTIGGLGNGLIRTPALDRLCREGTAFTSAYSPSPVCVPARCSLHYGQYPVRTRCFDNGDAMPVDRPSCADLLSQAGYRTHAVGKCHFTPDCRALRGFQSRDTQEEIPAPGSDDYVRWLEAEGFGHVHEPHGVRSEMYYIPQVSQLPARLHPTQWVGDRACGFIEEASGAQQPWMLMASFIHPHPPFAPPVPWNKLYRCAAMPPPLRVPDEQALLTHVNAAQNRTKYRDAGWDLNLVRQIRAHYYGCISFVDYQVGRMLQALEAHDQLDRTLILFTSDHGEHLGDRGCFGKRSMHDVAARIPLLARLPQRFRPGITCEAPASLVDVAPTLLSAAGVEADPAAFDGEDLAEVALGITARKAVFSQYGRGGSASYMAVTDDWKYIYAATDDREFLFSRRGDPAETRNQAASTRTRGHLDRMRQTTLAPWQAADDGEAVSAGGWRRYPVRTMPADPDALLLIQDPSGWDTALPGYDAAP